MPETHTVGVTGAAGYIGSRVTANLLDAGHEVVPVDNFYQPKVESIDGRAIEDVDVRDRGALREAFAGVDAVMHLAAITGVEECGDDPEYAFDVNVGGTENVAWLCRERGVPMAFPASMAVLGDPVEFPIDADHPRDPINDYGRTKAMSEDDVRWLADGAFPGLVLLKSNLYGHHRIDGKTVGKRTVINIFVERALDGDPLTVHEPGTQARDFVHVADIGRVYELALDYLIDAEDGAVTVPIASGDCRSILEIAELVRRIVEEERGRRVEVELVENPRGAETVGEDFTVDTAHARDLLGFEPAHTIEDTVREMVRE